MNNKVAEIYKEIKAMDNVSRLEVAASLLMINPLHPIAITIIDMVSTELNAAVLLSAGKRSRDE